jgi:putative spermidine/putrescine transport system ATP-binding protein
MGPGPRPGCRGPLTGMGADATDRVVEFDRVAKTYDGRSRVVDDLNLSIKRGEFLSLLGPSGSGKTTTLMMLAGFETPTAGEIRLNGRALNHVPPYRRDIGMVFQNYALFPHLSVEENVAFPLSVRNVPKAERAARIKRALDMVRLAGMEGRRPGQLSGGQQQRVAVARALVFEPRVVLMDEPLGALDRQLREQMQLEIRYLHQRLDVTMVYVTHDQGEALTMSDRIAVFSQGRVQQLADPRTLYEQPANLFVAGFIGENNRLPGTCITGDRDGDGISVRLSGGEVIRAAAGSVRPGQSCVVSLRPERIVARAGSLEGNAAAAGSNSVAAMLAETIYLGDHVRLRLKLADQTDLMATMPVGMSAGLPQPGQPVIAEWSPEFTLVFGI